MKIRDRKHIRRAFQQGLTLVELMIGLVIGLVMTGAISYLFIDASRNYRITENLARMQETSRFAFDKIGRDARAAGYYGCAGEEVTIDNMLNSSTDYLYRFGAAVEAFVAPASGWPAAMIGGFGTPSVVDAYSTTRQSIQNLVSGSHILTLRGLPDGDISVRSQPGGSSIKFTNTNGIKQGDILLVTTCRNAAVFQVSQVQNPTAQNPFTNVVHNTGQIGNPAIPPGNATNKTDEDLAGGEVMRVATMTYFVAVSPFHNRPSLFRRTTSSDAVEIARNVTNIQIEAGLDNDGDRQTDEFLSTASIPTADWEKVRAIRVQLTLESEDQSLAPDGGPLTYTTTTTFALRNRLP